MFTDNNGVRECCKRYIKGLITAWKATEIKFCLIGKPSQIENDSIFLIKEVVPSLRQLQVSSSISNFKYHVQHIIE